MLSVENATRRGPTPARTGGTATALSAQRAKVLEALQERGEPVTAARLAHDLDLHTNTVREHLDDLADRELAVRSRAAAAGRGRPAWTYRAAPLTEHDPRVREYAGLAIALAGHIARTSHDPVADALAAGNTWGRELIGVDARTEGEPVHPDAVPGSAHPRRTTVSEVGARRRVMELLGDLGFDPVSDRQVHSLALRRCPLLDAAQRHPQVVCGVHLGVVRGALEVLGADTRHTDLKPFAEPGACRLTLG
jgi:predicted ArsR family transcriptional regulator